MTSALRDKHVPARADPALPRRAPYLKVIVRDDFTVFPAITTEKVSFTFLPFLAFALGTLTETVFLPAL